MSDIPTNKPLGILKTSNRNDNFKVPSLGVSKPEKEQNKSWHYNTTPRPTKAVNNENINPNGNFPESTKETPGKTIFELCKQMSALALLTPDGMQQSTRDTQAQPKKVKLPFSEPFAGVDKLVEKDYLSDPEEIEPDNVPRKTLVITDDDEFFTDASEYFKNEDLNIDNTSDNDAFKSLESSPRTSLNVAGTLMKNNNSGERDSESAIIGIDETQEASLPEKISDKNIHEKLEYIEPEINSDLFNEAIHNQNIGNLSESHENKNPSSQVICIEPETVAEHHAEDFTNLPKDAKLTNSTDVENGDYLKIIDQNSDSIPIDEKSVNVIKSVEMANDSSNASTNESYILQPPVDEKQNTDILDVCKVEEKIAEISIPEKFDNFNAEDKSKDRTPDSSSVNTSEISNQMNESVATGSTKTDKHMSGSKETVNCFEPEMTYCLTLKEKSSENVEHFECSPKIDAANVDAEKTEENNSNLLESQNVDCSHESPKPQSTEENTSENAHLSKAIDNASVAENVEIKKPVADIGRLVDEKPVPQTSVNVIQSVETPNDSSDPLTMAQPLVDKKQNSDILDTCKVEEKIAEISIPENFDNFNDQDKSKDRTPDTGSVAPPEISKQINESVATGSTKTDKNMSASETTLMTVQTEEKISGAKEIVDSLETEIANCLTSKEKSSDNVEHFECSSKIGTANVDAEKTEEKNSNLLESQNESPKPQSTEENTSRNAQLSKAIDNASVAENVEIKKPVADIGRPVDEKPVPQSSVNVIQSVETPNDSSDPLTMAQPPVDEKQNTDILDTCKVEERIAEISIPENFDNFNEDKSKDKTPDSSSVGSSEISNQIHESVATGSTKTDKHMSASETTLMTVQTEEKISGAKEFVDSFETGIANCLTTKEKIPEEKSSDNVEHFECSSKIGTANVDAEKTEEKNSNLLESQNIDCSHGYPKPQLAEENTHENAPLSKAIDNASVAENVEIKKPVADIGRPNDIEEVMESSEVKDASDHSKVNCEIPNSIAASDDNLQKFETISNPSVFKDVDTFSTNTHLLNSPKSIQGSQSNIDISFEGRTQMANSPGAAVAVENDIQIDITPTSPNKQQQVGNGKHAGSQSRQNINEKPNRKELNEITDLVTAVNDTHICEDDISTILKGAEPSDSAETANYDEQEPNIQFEEKTNGFICDDDDWELLNCDKTVINASRLCRESLYVKFDPLLGLNNTIDFDMNKRKSVSKQPALEKIKSPPKSPDLIMMDSPTRKSMYQKVNPLRKTNNSTNNNLDDIFSLSPANNNADAIFFGTPLPQKKNSEIVQVLKYTEEDWLKMKQNIELEYQNRLMSASKELTHKMSELTEEHQKALNEKDVEMEQRKKDLLQLQTEKKAGQEKLNEMKKVLDEYTVLMDHLAAEKQKRADDYTKGIDGSKKEVDLIQDELQTVQKAYSDLHRRFEKAKTIIESLKKNEEMLKDHVKDMVSKVKEGKVALVTLKKESQETQSNLEKEVAALKKKLTIDTSCLEASGKRKDMKIAELQNELELKKNQIKELTKICDDLMEKVG